MRHWGRSLLSTIDLYLSVQNKCALYWAEGEDGNTAEFNIYEGTMTVMMKDKSTNPSSGYIKRVFEVVKEVTNVEVDF